MQPTESFADILAAHLAAYPLMRPEDAYKLAYQSEFGGGHMVTDEQESLLRIERDSRPPAQTWTTNAFCRKWAHVSEPARPSPTGVTIAARSGSARPCASYPRD